MLIYHYGIGIMHLKWAVLLLIICPLQFLIILPHTLFYFTNTTQKPFGCTIFPLLRPYNNHKFAFRSTPCVYLGPSPSHLGSRCLNLSNDRVYIARHVVFNPSLFLYRSHIAASQAPKDYSNFPWLHIKSVPPSSTSSVRNSGQTSTPSNIPLFSTTDQSSNNSLLST